MNILKIQINGISQWIQGKQSKLEAQVLKKAFLEMTVGKYGCSKRSWVSDLMDVEGVHEEGPGPERQNVGL